MSHRQELGIGTLSEQQGEDTARFQAEKRHAQICTVCGSLFLCKVPSQKMQVEGEEQEKEGGWCHRKGER